MQIQIREYSTHKIIGIRQVTPADLEEELEATLSTLPSTQYIKVVEGSS